MIKDRIAGIQQFLPEGEAALICADSNRLYFTGLHSSAGTVLVTKNSSYLLIDFRYFEKAKRLVDSSRVILSERLYKQLAELLVKENIKTILLETGSMSLESYNAYKNALPDFCFSESDRLQRKINELRSIKSAEELELITRAQELTDRTFDYIISRIKPGMTEREIMLDMEFFMRKNGSEGVAFDTIVVSGKNSSMPHGVPSDKPVESGDFITMDFGAVVGGYRSDMTRTVALGGVGDKQREVYETVLKAQESALAFIRAGVICCDVDSVARGIISDAGYGNCFGHGLGHSVGIDIHESPACNTRCETVMKPGMIMTVEPGIYIENEFGVRIEDMVSVTTDGCVNITKSPKSLIIL